MLSAAVGLIVGNMCAMSRSWRVQSSHAAILWSRKWLQIGPVMYINVVQCVVCACVAWGVGGKVLSSSWDVGIVNNTVCSCIACSTRGLHSFDVCCATTSEALSPTTDPVHQLSLIRPQSPSVTEEPLHAMSVALTGVWEC